MQAVKRRQSLSLTFKLICTFWSLTKILIKNLKNPSSNVHTFIFFRSALIYGECGGNYAGVRGHIASPGFPFNDYPAEQDCHWVIEVPTNLYVEVRRKKSHFSHSLDVFMKLSQVERQ